jgi:hypothetical protein
VRRARPAIVLGEHQLDALRAWWTRHQSGAAR